MPNCDGCGPRDGSNNKENSKKYCEKTANSEEKPGCCASTKSCCGSEKAEELTLDEREARLIKRLEEIRRKRKSLEQVDEIDEIA